MGSIGFFMFQVVGICVLTMIALTIASIALPRRSRRSRQAPARRRPTDREMHHTGRR